MKKVLFVAKVVKHHIMPFHIPYLEYLKKHGYETHVCARNDYENKKDCNIPYCDKYFDILFGNSPFSLRIIVIYKRLKKIIELNKYDIIHCHTSVSGVLTRLAARDTRKKGTIVIYTAHGFYFYKGAPLINWLIYYPIERWMAKYTDVLITINKEDYNRAKKSFKAKEVVYVPGVGIDTKKYSDIIIDKEEKRKELGIPKNAFVVLSVGELNKRKNHETIIKAISKLNNSDIYYVICGQGSLEKYLRVLSKELDVEHHIKLLGFRNDIAEICKSADVFAFPSYREGLPMALMEAMAVGLPIVCSKIRGNIDLIEDGKGGYLIEPNDVIGFTDCINKLIRNDDLRENMGIYNKNTVAKYDISNVKKYMEEIYNKADQELLDNNLLYSSRY